MEQNLFECINCGHFTPFGVNTRPRCAKCGGLTGLVNNDTESPRFRPLLQPGPAPAARDAQD